MSLPRYPQYQDSGTEWLGSVPKHWTVARARSFGSFASSGIDKKSIEGETSVQMFNYLDVYRSISKVLRYAPALMETTAPAGKVAEHSLVKGDILLTPSSETADDIGHAARVVEDLPNVVYSYHLLRFRPYDADGAGFLTYLLNAVPTRLYFASVCTGTTRLVLGREDFKSAPICLPPPEEQSEIVAFLDRETAKIDALIAEHKKLLTLLAEKRQATIFQAVTRGFDHDAPMKDSDISWLGQVPAHWEVGAVKRFLEVLDGRRVPLSAEERSYRSGEYPYYGASGVIDVIDDFIFDEDLVLVSEDGANLLNRSSPIAFVATGKYWVNNHAHILRPFDGLVSFWAARIEALDLAPVVTGSAQPKLTIEALANFVVAVPPERAERADIVNFIVGEAERLIRLESEAQRAIELFTERRSALIAAAVTGKIDVRGLAPEISTNRETVVA